MLYQSTRNDELRVESAETVVAGIAPDGGLFVPVTIPTVDNALLSDMAQSSYASRAVAIMSLFFTDFSQDEMSRIASAAYNKERFETDSVAPLYRLDSLMYVQELWHGPTCAFKDVALQVLPHLLTASMRKKGRLNDVVILTATSGDTGKAALEGFKNVPKTKIIVFYPKDGVSDIQQLQMLTQEGDNVYVCAVEGNFDVAQAGVKQIFANPDVAQKLKQHRIELTSANSINWGRLAPQIVYYFSAYLDLLKNSQINEGEEINFVVPTGNFGNILAAYYAKCMGLPIHKLVCASNCNNILTEFIKTGVYDKNREFFNTISPSMDILVSSNLERLLFHMTNGNTRLISEWMGLLNSCGRYELTDPVHEAIKNVFWAGYCDDTFTKKTIKDVENAFSYVVDPHTAVAVDVYWQYLRETGDKRKTVIASTASPFKFTKSVMSALVGEGIEARDCPESSMLEELAGHAGIRIPAALSELSKKEIRFEDVCSRDDMQRVVLERLLG